MARKIIVDAFGASAGAQSPKSVVQQVIDEIESGYKAPSGGPLKEIHGVVRLDSRFDPDRNELVVGVGVTAYQDSHYGYSANTRCDFELTLGELRNLADTAPRFQSQFAHMAHSAQNLARAMEKWHAEGMPTAQATTVMKPLRLKPGQG